MNQEWVTPLQPPYHLLFTIPPPIFAINYLPPPSLPPSPLPPPSQPAQMAPIHVVEMVNVPAELRLDSRDYNHSGYSRSLSSRYGLENQYQYGATRVRGLTYPTSVSATNLFTSLEIKLVAD